MKNKRLNAFMVDKYVRQLLLDGNVEGVSVMIYELLTQRNSDNLSFHYNNIIEYDNSFNNCNG